MKETKIKWSVFIITGGFYFFGQEVAGTKDFLHVKNGAMFGSFSGGKGVAGVCRGDSAATVVLDRFEQEEVLIFPIAACAGILPSINLYEFSGATLR